MIPAGASVFISKMGILLPAPLCVPHWVAVRNKPDHYAGKGLADRPVPYARRFPFSVIQE